MGGAEWSTLSGNLRQQRDALINEARDIVQQAKADHRDLTASEQRKFDDYFKQIDGLDERIKSANESQERFDRLAAITDPGADDPARSKGYLGSRKNMANKIVRAMGNSTGATYGRKALLVDGDVYADVPLLSADPFAMARPPASLVDALPVGTLNAPTYNYLQQTSRTNNAAPVASGGTKPTSVYGLTQRSGSLHVVAHISEPFDEYWVADTPSLSTFLQNEMVAGLYSALEQQILTGNGTAPNLCGLANASGIQTQAWDTDLFTTTRKAITALESLGYVPRAFVVGSADWERVETAAFSSGNHVLNGTNGSSNLPVHPAARRLWGVPVVLCTSQAAGAGWLLADGAVELVTDGQVKTVPRTR